MGRVGLATERSAMRCIAKDAATRKALRHHVLMGNGERIHDPRHTRNLKSDRLGRPLSMLHLLAHLVHHVVHGLHVN
jgi:hypothetical protein